MTDGRRGLAGWIFRWYCSPRCLRNGCSRDGSGVGSTAAKIAVVAHLLCRYWRGVLVLFQPAWCTCIVLRVLHCSTLLVLFLDAAGCASGAEPDAQHTVTCYNILGTQ